MTNKQTNKTMKKYYVIKLVFDDGFWSELHQDFKGWLYASKYDKQYGIDENHLLTEDCPFQHAMTAAAQKKPITILEVFENE